MRVRWERLGRPSDHGGKDGNSVRQTVPHGHGPATVGNIECPCFFVYTDEELRSALV